MIFGLLYLLMPHSLIRIGKKMNLIIDDGEQMNEQASKSSTDVSEAPAASFTIEAASLTNYFISTLSRS